MTLFDELNKNVRKNSNDNFHFDKLNWVTQVWIKSLCELVDEKLKTKNNYHPLNDLDG
jgi:hypothetical protein